MQEGQSDSIQPSPDMEATQNPEYQVKLGADAQALEVRAFANEGGPVDFLKPQPELSLEDLAEQNAERVSINVYLEVAGNVEVSDSTGHKTNIEIKGRTLLRRHFINPEQLYSVADFAQENERGNVPWQFGHLSSEENGYGYTHIVRKGNLYFGLTKGRDTIILTKGLYGNRETTSFSDIGKLYSDYRQQMYKNQQNESQE